VAVGRTGGRSPSRPAGRCVDGGRVGGEGRRPALAALRQFQLTQNRIARASQSCGKK